MPLIRKQLLKKQIPMVPLLSLSRKQLDEIKASRQTNPLPGPVFQGSSLIPSPGLLQNKPFSMCLPASILCVTDPNPSTQPSVKLLSTCRLLNGSTDGAAGLTLSSSLLRSADFHLASSHFQRFGENGLPSCLDLSVSASA